MARTTN